MGDMYFLHRANPYNDYIDRRVRVTISGNRQRQRVYLGTFKAFDEYLNVVLADAYRVVFNCSEDQKVDLRGLMVFRGAIVKSITLERHERHLPDWPSRPKASKPVKPKVPKKKPAVAVVPAAPAAPVKPLKLKRTWLATPTPSVKVEPISPLVIKEEPKDDTKPPPKPQCSRDGMPERKTAAAAAAAVKEEVDDSLSKDSKSVSTKSLSSSSEDELLISLDHELIEGLYAL